MATFIPSISLLSPLPLGCVSLKGELFQTALQGEASYLLSLEEGRLLAGFFENAGLKTPFVRYGGWENTLIGGHTTGHVLSALAHASQNGGIDENIRKKLYQKLERLVNGLGECQSPQGFLWGATPLAGGAEAQFDNVERGKTDIHTQAWVPWYTMHKLIAGLVDAYAVGGCKAALDIAVALGDWAYARASKWDGPTRALVLQTEYGGMNDCLYSLYSLTGKPEHALAAHIFDEEPLFDAILTEAPDVLKGKHANTTIPKILGALNRYLTLHGRELGGEKIDAERYLHVAEAFFRMVHGRHAYVTGGFSENEHFGGDFVLDVARTNCNNETCTAYNMLKLARLLFRVTADTRYTDYYDNVFTNSILPSRNPQTGMTTYFQPMASGYFKVFSTPYDHFWCCTGSGMESFSKLGDSAFYRRGSDIYIEQYLAADCKMAEFSFSLACNFPFCDYGVLRVTASREKVRFFFRVPDWAAAPPAFAKNGVRIFTEEVDGHVAVEAAAGDEIVFTVPAAITLKGLPDGDGLAFRYGGVVLSCGLGAEDMATGTTGENVAIPLKKGARTDEVYFPDLAKVLENPARYMRREGELFTLTGGDVALEFCPHYRQYSERYAIYVRLLEGVRKK